MTEMTRLVAFGKTRLGKRTGLDDIGWDGTGSDEVRWTQMTLMKHEFPKNAPRNDTNEQQRQ